MEIRRLMAWTTITLLACTGSPAPNTTSAPIPPASTGPAAPSGERPDEATQAAITAVLDAFDDHSVVAIGEIHGSPVEHRFLAALLRDPRTSSVVDDVAVEFGSARYQTTIDAYVDGTDVPDADLRLVWEDTTQTSGVWSQPVYRSFFETVREVNASLPAVGRLRVLLGDPPIDWSTITARSPCDDTDPSCEDYWLFRRDEHFASVVERESLSRDRRVLLVAGSGHVMRTGPVGLTLALDELHPGATYVIVPFDPAGGADPAVTTWLAARPAPSLIQLAGTWLGEQAAETRTGSVSCDGPGCGSEEAPNSPTQTLAQLADALLYLGPSLWG
jgi:hypothetical protein